MAHDNKLNTFWYGVVEDINDPLASGRVRVRRLDQTPNRQELPTCALPWSVNSLRVVFENSSLQINDFVYGNLFDDIGTLNVQGKYPGEISLPANSGAINTTNNYYKKVWQHFPVAMQELYKTGVPKDLDWRKLREDLHRDTTKLIAFEEAVQKASEEIDLPEDRRKARRDFIKNVINDYSSYKFNDAQVKILLSRNEQPGWGITHCIVDGILAPAAPYGTMLSATQLFGSGAISNLPLASSAKSMSSGSNLDRGNGDPNNNTAYKGSTIELADRNRVHVCSISQSTKQAIYEFVLLVRQAVAAIRDKLEAAFASESASPLLQTIRNKIRKFARELKRILKLVKIIKKLITAIQELIKLAAEILKWILSLPAILASIVAQCASELISELKSAIAGGIVSGVVSDTQPPTIIDRFSDSFQNVQDQFDVTANATQDFFNGISSPEVESDILSQNMTTDLTTFKA
jgi:hypothetical protein